MPLAQLAKIAKLVRYWILTATTRVGSGHPTSCLSAVELMVALMFGNHFRFDLAYPDHPNNDRLIFSKGHAAPLLYTLWCAAGAIDEKELLTLRQFGSRLEGHPTPAFPFVKAATGSLGQGLSIGLGMALNAKYLDKLPYYTWVLLGDSEMTEGSNWEAIQLAAHYRLDNLVGIIDVNRLGQTGETMIGHRVDEYQKRITTFGWETIVIDGHSLPAINQAYQKVKDTKKPLMVIAKTIKGKGISFLEDRENWHGQALKPEQLKKALDELGKVDKTVRGRIKSPENRQPPQLIQQPEVELDTSYDQPLATRQAYGHALVEAFPQFPQIVVLDAEVSNSTYAATFKKAYPDRFFEMYLGEQNMVGVALGLSTYGKIPFVSSFAAFLSRAFDQIRMSQYSNANIKFVGSHAGVSIGPDGPSQMGLEDLAMFRTLIGSVVLYPADHVANEKLVKEAAKHKGIVYLRTTRMETPPLYKPSEEFPLGGSKVLKSSSQDKVSLVAAGITLYEALKAYRALKKEGLAVRVIDLYSIKPIDRVTLIKAAKETRAIITVEDHFKAGGIGEAVKSVLSKEPVPIYSLAVRKVPKSGAPEKQLDYQGISAQAIYSKVKEVLKS